MSKSPKLIFLAAGGVVGAVILILIAVVVLLILGVNAKRQVQTLVSDALEMEVNVDGRLDIGFFPSLHITMENVQIRNRGSEIVPPAHCTGQPWDRTLASAAQGSADGQCRAEACQNLYRAAARRKIQL